VVLGERAAILSARHEGIDLLVLHCTFLFDRDGGPYIDQYGADYHDNRKRFAALSFATAKIAEGLVPGWRPHVVHLHDWQTGLAAVYLNQPWNGCSIRRLPASGRRTFIRKRRRVSSRLKGASSLTWKRRCGRRSSAPTGAIPTRPMRRRCSVTPAGFSRRTIGPSLRTSPTRCGPSSAPACQQPQPDDHQAHGARRAGYIYQGS
jgi:hypothetical protein